MTRKMHEYDPTIIFEPRPVVVGPGTVVVVPGPTVFVPTILEARAAEEIRLILEANAMLVQAQQMQQAPTVQAQQMQQAPTVQAQHVQAQQMQAPTVQQMQAPTVQVQAKRVQAQRVQAKRVQEPTKKQQLAEKLLGERPKQKENKHSRCGCYKEGTTDARCCGLCYCLCPARHISRHIDRDRCDFCPETFTEYLDSGYVRTHGGYGQDNYDDCFCTVLCLPFKFPFFFPCAIGSIINSALNRSHLINCCCYSGRDVRNYLF